MKRGQLHQARIDEWPTGELKAHLGEIVDALAERGACSVLDVMLELLGGELPTFLLVGRAGHLDPPRLDGKIAWATLTKFDDDPAVNEAMREAVRNWLDKAGN